MSLDQIYQLKHELWLKILFSSFALKDEKHKSYIYDMANIEFRHMKWLSNNMKEQNISYNYDKYAIDMPNQSVFEILEYIEEIRELSIPPLNNEPTFISLFTLFSTLSNNISSMVFKAISSLLIISK